MGCHFLLQHMKVKSESEVAQSYLTLSDPLDCSPTGSSIHGIFQARVLEWGAIAFSERTNPREYQVVRTHTGNHLNTRPSITQLAVAPCAGCLIQTTDKTKTQTKSSAERITTSLSPTCKRGKKNSTNLTLYEAYTKLDQT